jgi:hypothetical protein
MKNAEPSSLEMSHSFADSLVADLMNRRELAVRTRMTNAFQVAASQTQFLAQMHILYEKYGNITSYLYKVTESTPANDGLREQHAARRVWYAVTTTRYPRGDYFLFVDIVVEGERLACDGFSFVTFPGGAPEELK